jgi:hypothetical protein
MSRLWADALDDPGVAAEVRAGRTEEDRRGARRRGVRRRRGFALFILVAVVVGVVISGTSLARDDDAFAGTWWEPDSGRRIEIVRQDGGYTLLYGAERRPFAAEKRGDELVIATPLGGDIVVRAVAADRLELIDGGRTTTLQPAPDGS